MKFKFYFDHELGLTHIEKHGVTGEEINEFFMESDYLDFKREDGSWVGIGKLKSGRYLKVVFRVKTPEKLFIITAYTLDNPEAIEYLEAYLQEL